MAKQIGRYTYRVAWSAEDHEHVGLCAETPCLSGSENTPEKALAGIRRVVQQVGAELKRYGEEVPEPVAMKS